jgi:hypothetical protein
MSQTGQFGKGRKPERNARRGSREEGEEGEVESVGCPMLAALYSAVFQPPTLFRFFVDFSRYINPKAGPFQFPNFLPEFRRISRICGER